MKKKLVALFIILLVGMLFACGTQEINSTENDNENEINNGDEDTTSVAIEEYSFIGTIEEINGTNAIVSVEEGEILNSGNKVDVNLSVASDTTFQVGDKVKVGYDGVIREIFPLGINTISVEKIN